MEFCLARQILDEIPNLGEPEEAGFAPAPLLLAPLIDLTGDDVVIGACVMKGLDDLSENLNLLANELTTFFANFDSDIDGYV